MVTTLTDCPAGPRNIPPISMGTAWAPIKYIYIYVYVYIPCLMFFM
jgi:hypothetical protein